MVAGGCCVHAYSLETEPSFLALRGNVLGRGNIPSITPALPVGRVQGYHGPSSLPSACLPHTYSFRG